MRRAALCLILLALGPIVAPRARADDRKVKITWRDVENAAKYDFEISTTPEMDPLLDRQTYDTTEIKMKLKPGSYFFRVRGLDQSGEPGPWSEVQGFVVNQKAPRQKKPASDAEISGEALEKGIHFEWEEGLSGTKYLFEVLDKKGAVIKRSVNDTVLEWKPPNPGAYEWRVGFESPTGDEWGKPRKFKVKEPLPKPKPAEVVKAEPEEREKAEREPSSPAPAREDAKVETKDLALERKSEWLLIGRVAQSVVAYNGSDSDSGAVASGAALVGLFSAELRWRQGKRAEQLWTWSGALNFEVIRQVILNADFTMPRFNARAILGREIGKGWRFGGMLQANAGQSGIFVVQSPTQALKTKVTRKALGLGGIATYRPAPTMILSALTLFREDFGGSSPDLPNSLGANLGFEAGFGVGVDLGARLLLEGRLRAMGEAFSWKPAKAGAADSSLSDTFIILDVGLGYRF